MCYPCGWNDRRWISALAAAVAVAVLSVAANGQSLTSFSPTRGSLAGGTRLVLLGVGFSRGGVMVCTV